MAFDSASKWGNKGQQVWKENGKFYHNHTFSVGGVDFQDDSVVFTVGTAESSLIAIPLSSLLELFQYVDFTSACWQSNNKPHRPEHYAVVYQWITYWLEVKLIRKYFSSIRRHQNIHSSITRVLMRQ